MAYIFKSGKYENKDLAEVIKKNPSYVAYCFQYEHIKVAILGEYFDLMKAEMGKWLKENKSNPNHYACIEALGFTLKGNTQELSENIEKVPGITQGYAKDSEKLLLQVTHQITELKNLMLNKFQEPKPMQEPKKEVYYKLSRDLLDALPSSSIVVLLNRLHSSENSDAILEEYGIRIGDMEETDTVYLINLEDIAQL
jgi:hypothetical protein